ncbi:hypothetical protein FOA52_007286 [Chlamydomonas sp. UWO 241]|nr:hypothetical protein FOA52_007286 [Chlamydomonas sp. UWO 241]
MASKMALCLLALAVLAACPAAARNLTQSKNWVLLGFQDQCLNATQETLLGPAGAPQSGALSKVDCDKCMTEVDKESKLTTIGYMCTKQLCQNVKLFPWPANVTAAAAITTCQPCILGSINKKICQACHTMVPRRYSALGESTDSDGIKGAAVEIADVTGDVAAEARAWCLKAATFTLPGYNTVLGFAGDWQFDKYLDAVTVCVNLPDGSPERTWCMNCIYSSKMQEWPVGLATRWDMEAADWPRDNDFGACANFANHTYAVNKGWENPGGMYTECGRTDFTDAKYRDFVAPELTASKCITCMDDALTYTVVAFNDVVQPINSSKAYACYDTCRNPALVPDTNVGITTGFAADELSSLCTDCVTDPNVYDAYGCTNCLKQFSETQPKNFDVAKFNVQGCLKCVGKNPYEDVVGNYNWACGECAAMFPGDNTTRTACEDCIKQRAVDSSTLAADLMNQTWVGTTYEIICMCVDMAKTQWLADPVTSGSLTEWYTQTCTNCSYQEQKCYRKRNVTLPVAKATDAVYVLRDLDHAVNDDELPAIYRKLKCSDFELGVDGFGASIDALDGVMEALNISMCAIEGINETFATAYYASTRSGGDGAICSLLPGGPINTNAGASAIPWCTTNLPGWKLIHVDDNLVDATSGDDCVACMRNDTIKGTSFTPACLDYCNNPYTIHNQDELTQCTQCVIARTGNDAPRNNPAPCEQCIQQFNELQAPFTDYPTANYISRKSCIACTIGPTFWGSDRDSACSACAAFTNEGVRNNCFACVAGNYFSPWACVDGFTNGWLDFVPLDLCTTEASVTASLASTNASISLQGGWTDVGAPFSRESCASKAQSVGATIFGLVNGGAKCYWSKSNKPFMLLSLTNNGDCSGTPCVTGTTVVNGATETTPAPSYTDDIACGGAAAVAWFGLSA